MPHTARRRIGIVMHGDQFVSRGVLRGVLKYVAENPGWTAVGGTSPARAASVFRRWAPDGIITSFTPHADFKRPTVAVVYPNPGVLRVAMDDAQAGLLAVQHFRERGFRHFAFVGYRGRWWSDDREAGFVSALRRLVPETQEPIPRFLSGRFQQGRWQSSSRRLVAWLASLPKPVAVFACNDTRGRETIDAALAAGLRIPDEVAVLGVDNDYVECEMAPAPLSSIVYPCEEVGYQAAALLARLMNGLAARPDAIHVAPVEIRTRRSTDVLAVDDAAVAAAYRFIQDHAGTAIGVTDVARHAGVARRTLQLHYHRVLGRSVRDDLLHARIRLATELLRNSRLPLKEVAARTGFGSAAHLSRIFQRKQHTTPGRLRRHDASEG